MARSSSDYTLGRPRGGWAVAVLASAFVAACVTFPRAPDEGGSPWISVQTPHFTLATDMEKAPAENLARMLEDTWTAMEYALESLPGGALDDVAGSEPVLVIALKNDREREAVHKRLGGVFSAQSLLPPAVSIGDIDANRGAEVLKHELAHAVLSKRLPRVPRWLNEGIAVYLQTAELDRDRQAVEWGIWSEHDMRMLREYGSRASVDALFDSERWKSSVGAYALEIEAGLLVHMLVNRYPGQLGCYLKGLATDLDPNAAMACFPDRTRWNYEVKEYDYDAPAAGKRASVAFPDVEVSTATLGDARVHAVLAMLDYMVVSFVEPQFQADRYERAQRHLARALEIDPAERLAILLTLTRTDPSGARRAELAKRLVDSHPDTGRPGSCARARPALRRPSSSLRSIARGRSRRGGPRCSASPRCARSRSRAGPRRARSRSRRGSAGSTAMTTGRSSMRHRYRSDPARRPNRGCRLRKTGKRSSRASPGCARK